MPDEPVFQTNEDMPENPRSSSDRDRLRERVESLRKIRIGRSAANKSDPSILDIRKEMVACENKDCDNVTNRPSGFCKECEDKLGDFLNTEILRCKNCMVAATCKYSKNKNGVCVYELDLDKSKMKEREDATEEMRTILKRDKKMIERFDRFLTSLDLAIKDDREMFLKIQKEMKQWQTEFMKDLKSFSTFQGWTQAERGDVEILKLRLKALDKTFGKGMRRKNMTSPVPPPISEDERPVHVVKVPQGQSKAIPDDFEDDDEVTRQEEMMVRDDLSLEDDNLILERMQDAYEQSRVQEEGMQIEWSSGKGSDEDGKDSSRPKTSE